MKRFFFLLLAACANNAIAAPPVLNAPVSSSSATLPYYSPTDVIGSTQSLTNQIVNTLNKLQGDVTQLKSKVVDQTNLINDLKSRLNNVEKAYSINVQSPIGVTPLVTMDDKHTSLPGEKGRYDYALSIFKMGNYDQAIAEFQSVISTYPNGDYADNAQYWTGEALLKKGDKQAAMQAFDRVVYAYPRSSKVPDALLKLGMTQAAAGNKPKAKEYYDYLIAAYPGTSAATNAYGKRASLY
jgi:tol-pal system protein YbgF